MQLQEIINISMNKELASTKQGLSEERINNQLDNLRTQIAFFRQYPDVFVDKIKGPDCNFKFYFYQRVFLRSVMRHRYIYATFPRAFSKSFLSMMALMLRCILYPNSHLFVTTGGKEQAASITVSKIDEICKLIPALSNEINWDRGVSVKSKNDARYVFRNGSVLDVLAASERSRGQRRTGGLMEECVSIDQDILNEVIIPTTNVDRLLPDGTRDSAEMINKSQVYITTAGYKGTFAYLKLIELLIRSIIEPESTFILGGTYKIPVKEGLLDKDFVNNLKLDGTYQEDSFDREYRSKWSGSSEDSFYSSEVFDKCRTFAKPEYQYSKKTSEQGYYILGIDVGRTQCTTEICVFKVTPQIQGAAIKTLVNIYTYEAEHFEIQSINIKRIFFKYKARTIAIDANGVGAGLVDMLTIKQVDPDTGDELPALGVLGGTSEEAVEQYKKIKGPGVIEDILYLIKANAAINTEAYSYAKAQMMNNKIKLLLDEATAKAKLMSTKLGQQMDIDQRNEYLQPYVYTSILKSQMMNLTWENEGQNIILKQANRGIKKDKFSAFIYGLYYTKQVEDKKRTKKTSIADLLFFSKK